MAFSIETVTTNTRLLPAPEVCEPFDVQPFNIPMAGLAAVDFSIDTSIPVTNAHGGTAIEKFVAVK